jgi:hypothetical protein
MNAYTKKFNRKLGSGSVTLVLLARIPPSIGDSENLNVFDEDDFADSPQKIRERIKVLVQKKLPLTEATLRKVNIPIPSETEGHRRMILQHVDDLISMTDGQLWFDDRLRIWQGQQPPLDPQRSVTRVGIGADTDSRADAAAFRRIDAEGLRLLLSQAAHMDGAEVTRASANQARQQKAYLLATYQKAGHGGRRLSESCTALLAASGGHLNPVVERGLEPGSAEGQQIVRDLLNWVVFQECPDVAAEIDKTLDISPESKLRLSSAIKAFFDSQQ